MADGKDCICWAYDPSECGCGADWTPQEIYDLRKEVNLLRIENAKLKEWQKVALAIGERAEERLQEQADIDEETI